MNGLELSTQLSPPLPTEHDDDDDGGGSEREEEDKRLLSGKKSFW